MKQLLALPILFLAARAEAATAFVAPFEAVNVSADDARAATMIFGRAYGAASGHAIVAPAPAPAPAPEEGTAPAAPTPVEACRQVGCGVLVTGGITRLGSKLVVVVSEADPSGRVVHTAQATAGSLDDLEQVLPRLAQATARRTSYERTLTPETVSQREIYPGDKMKATTLPGLRTGLVLGRLGDDSTTSVEATADLRFERGAQFVSFGVGLLFDASNDGNASATLGGLFAELGAGHYLSQGPVAPYVGVGLTPKVVGVERCARGCPQGPEGGAAQIGLGVQAKAGVMFLRTHTTRVFVEAAGEQELVELAGVRPQLLRISAGVAF